MRIPCLAGGRMNTLFASIQRLALLAKVDVERSELEAEAEAIEADCGRQENQGAAGGARDGVGQAQRRQAGIPVIEAKQIDCRRYEVRK